MSRCTPVVESRRGTAPSRSRSVLIITLLMGSCWTVFAWARESLDSFPKSTLEISTHQGQQRFSIWVADNPSREEQGLMFVRSLASNQGMLFPQDEPRVVTMWMKNTLIPLDMLFIDSSGIIIYIKHDATPESEDIITTPTSVVFNSNQPTPVQAVLELAGGTCVKRHIEPGDRVLHALFTQPATAQKSGTH